MTSVLELSKVDTYYGKIQALNQIDLKIDEGEIVTLLGSNGAGKSTTLKTISGLVHAKSGTIKFMGQDISRLPPHEIVKLGIIHVPEGRRIFGGLSVLENLELGSFIKRKEPVFVKKTMNTIFELFPRLHERRSQRAGTLSGGEQQMLAIGRAMMSDPKLLMLDEPSMGLAPIIVQEIMSTIKQLNEEGTTVLLVEQNARLALKAAHQGFVIETGEIILQDSAKNLRENDRIVKAYLSNA